MQKTLFLHQFYRYENFSFTAQPKKHCLNFSDFLTSRRLMCRENKVFNKVKKNMFDLSLPK